MVKFKKNWKPFIPVIILLSLIVLVIYFNRYGSISTALLMSGLDDKIRYRLFRR